MPVVALAGVLWLRLGSIAPELLDLTDSSSTVVVDRRGIPLYEALSGDGTRHIRLRADNLPLPLVNATVAAEDRRFWSHVGLDPVAIVRALRQNIVEGRIVEGGSTITQQVAKLLLNRRTPGRTRGWGGKVREAVVAFRLEHRFDKREILAMYLNLASYGNQLVGAERASRAYFGCEASMLTVAQSAFLAGLPQRPSSFNPYRNQQSATTRQRAVIRRMEAYGLLSSANAQEARGEQLNLTRRASPFLAPHFVEMVLASTPDRPARVDTTIDAALQEDIAGIIRSQRALLERHGAANVAVVVLDNVRGEWIAWEGSGDYFDRERGGAINGPVTLRQPGSTLKPFTYALAFEDGLTPASVLPDVPSHFPTAEQGVLYSPRNYDGRYRGPLLARRALAGSENVPAVALASNLGVPKLLRFLHARVSAASTAIPRYYGLGVTLGNAEVRLDELAAAYAAFARGGEWLEPHLAPIGRRARPETAGLADDRVLDHRHSFRSRRARVHLRPRRVPRVSVPGCGEDRHVAGVSRQLDGRLHARRHGGRLGGQLRSHAAQELVGRHWRWPDLPQRDARRCPSRAGPGSRRKRCRFRQSRRGTPTGRHDRPRILRAVRNGRQRLVPVSPARVGAIT